AMGIGGFNSRQAVMAGSSAHLAAVALREKVLAVAAKLLDVSADGLEIEGGSVQLRARPKTAIALGELARAMGGTPGFTLPGGMAPGLEVSEAFLRDEMAFANGAAAVEVEVDAETGAVEIRKFIIAHDCGRMINPVIVEGQIVGGVVHGIGNALFEWMGFDGQCQPVTTTFADYLLVTSTEAPSIDVLHMESPSPINPLGVKGVGECGVMPVAPAIMSAIEDALSPFAVKIARTPVTPAELAGAIQAARREKRVGPAL